jgi:hypothetical protein
MVMGSKPMWEIKNKNKNLLTKHMEQIELQIIVKSPIIAQPCKAQKRQAQNVPYGAWLGYLTFHVKKKTMRMREMGQPWTLA